MNQLGIQKTAGAMLLASGATLAIVILFGGTVQRFTSTEFQPVANTPTPGTSSALTWTNRLQQPNQWAPQNGYPETRQSSAPRQGYPVTNGHTQQVSYIADSNYATAPNLVHHHGARAHQNHSYQVTSYPAIEQPTLSQPNQLQANPNRAVAPRRAIPDYPLSQKLIRAHESLEEVTLSGPGPGLAEPTPATRPANELSETSGLAHVELAPASPRQESGEAFSVLQTNFETQIQKPDSHLSAANLTSQIRIGKGGFKTKEVVIKNDTFDEALDETPVELAVEPTAKPAASLHSLQPTTLPRRPVNPQTEVNANKRIQYGESLARRRSYHAAREEFILALLMIANSHGNESANDAHAGRLVQALAAMDEINDFASMRNRDGRDPQFQQTVYSHNTRILDGVDLNLLSPRKAIDLYCGFSQSQVEQAIGFSNAGSKALHALGKLELKATGTDPQHGSTSQTKALVFFRSSLSVNPKNALCANDLGVLLFNMGRLNEAEEALKRSLGSAQSREVWKNLASVHSQRAANATTVDQRNSQLRLVQLAEHEAQKFLNDPRQRGLADTEWATTNDFQNKAAFPDTVVQRASSGDAETSQPGGARVKAVSFLQKVTGWN